jgi:inorganic triphosphatase YgiF
MKTETELKLRIAPEYIDKFLRLPILQSAVQTTERQHLYNTYFDTAEHALLQQGVGLRVRHIGNQRLQTLKTAGMGLSGLHQRQEWEAKIAGDTPDYSLLAESPLSQWCTEEQHLQQVKPLFTTDFRRTTWDLTLEDGSKIEIALDQGEIQTATASTPLHEVELELKSGVPERLYQVALILQKSLPLVIENKSKAARGYALTKPLPLEFHKAHPAVGITPEMTAEQAFVKIIWHCLEHLQANEDMVIYGEDIEGVHQMRVALRRLRSTLSLYKPLIPNKTHTKVRKELKWFGNVLGVARDWDVFNLTLQNMLAQQLDYKVLQELHTLVTDQQTQAYTTVRETLQNRRYSRMLLIFGKWLTRRSWRLHLDTSTMLRLEQPTVAFASDILDKHYQQVCQEGEHLMQLGPEQRHQLRISIKKLAYGVRFFAELYSPADETPRLFAKSLSQLQEELGILNDANTTTQLLNQIGIDDNAPSRHFLNGWYAHQQAIHLAHLAAAWQLWREQKIFWK